jgi:farnesyl-diphosphate farnesyltransferase
MKKNDMLRVLKETSRTFYLPITRLPPLLQESISSAYLCMRALDEIEDHIALPNPDKAAILRDVSSLLQSGLAVRDVKSELDRGVFAKFRDTLPEVSLQIGDWLSFSPEGIRPRVWDATASMADRMANWADRNWRLENEADLDEYTFSVAGAVGLLICDVWAWFDATQLDRASAIHFGRGLQSVNILRNHQEDLQRGIDFFPSGWTQKEMLVYARRNLTLARMDLKPIPQQAFVYLVAIPLSLAEATLDAIENGQEKLSRQQVLRIIAQV